MRIIHVAYRPLQNNTFKILWFCVWEGEGEAQIHVFD